MAQGRVQAPDLQSNVRLTPAPMQSDTYAPPPQPAKNENLFRLADALSSFSGSVGNLVGVVGQKSKEERQREEAAFQMHVAGQTLGDTRKEIQAGRMMVSADKIQNASNQSYYGTKWAQALAADTDTELETTFDWDKGNPEEFLAKKFQESIQAEGNLTDPNAVAAAGRAWDSYKNSVLTKQQDYRNKRQVQSTVDTAFGVISDKSNEWIKAGMEPAKFAANLNQMRKELGIKGSLGANEETLDQEYLNAAARVAQTNPEYAVAMLDAEYDGRSGKTSLSAQRAYRDRVLQIKAEAAKAIGLRSDAEQKASMAASADDLIAAGKGDQITDTPWFDHKGEQHNESGETIKKEAYQRFLIKSRDTAAKDKETGEQTLARELRVANSSGVEHPGLKAEVGGIFQAASVDMTQDPQGMDRVMQKIKTAQWLYNNSKNTYMAYTKEEDRDFMESFIQAKNDMPGKDGRQMSDQAALEFAIRTSQPVQVDGLNFTKAQNDAIDAATKTLGRSPGWLWGENDAEPVNSAAAQQRVASMAKRFVRGGWNADKAIEAAKDYVKRTSTTYNGVLLETGSMVLPDNFKPAMDTIISDFVKENPRVLPTHDISAGDISIIPIGDINRSNGRFMLVSKEDGKIIPIMDDSGQPHFVTLTRVREVAKIADADATANATNSVTLQGAARARGLVSASDGRYVDPKTREYYDITIPEAGGAPVVKKSGQRAKAAVFDDKAKAAGISVGDLVRPPKDKPKAPKPRRTPSIKPLYDDNGIMPPLSPRASN
jgi:hypothetical protein